MNARTELKRSTLPTTLIMLITTAALVSCKKENCPAPADPEPPAGCIVDESYMPVVDPSNFDPAISVPNPYLLLVVGNTWTYEGEAADGTPTSVIMTVTDSTRLVMGVTCVIVYDQAFEDGELVEGTFGWFAQDLAGNVWYFGEAVQDFANGVLISTAGSWEAGVDGALPGIKMPGNPFPGDVYRQEYYACEAEDMARDLTLNASMTVPFGTFSGCLQTEEYTPLDAGVVEVKTWAQGIGLLKAQHTDTPAYLELVDFN